jgi:hypothetical protein
MHRLPALEIEEEPFTDLEFREFLDGYKPEGVTEPVIDLLENRFRIHLDKPLTEYNSTLSSAYSVTDEQGEKQNLFAMVTPTHLAYRTKTTEAFRNLSHSNLITLHAAGSAMLSNPRETRYILVFEQPAGVRLSALVQKHGALNERFVTERLIAPICEILSALQERGVNHGRLNLDTLYYKDTLTIGECISEPSGYSQPFIFEPVERILTQPLGKGSGELNADCFALGVITFFLLTGKNPANFMQDKQAYLRQIMQNGTYATLTEYHSFSPPITDLLRGVLNDNRMERWGVSEIREWLNGKRYNLIPPVPPRESTRSINFKGKDFMNCRALAGAFHENWNDAIEEIKNGKFDRWAQLSLNKQEMKEMLEKIIARSSPSHANSGRADNEMVARTIIALDPAGPIRMRSLSANVDGLGAVLADAFKQNHQDQITLLYDVIDNDLPNFWADQHKSFKNEEISGMLWRLQKVRLLMRNKSLGFGIERVLYELNPTMACQSPLLVKLHITNTRMLLQTLDRLASEQAGKQLPLDRHSAAFISTKLNLNKEVVLNEVSQFADLATDQRLLMLKLLAIAQEKENMHHLRGLANWMALSCFPVMEKIRNRRIRAIIMKEASAAARAGSLVGLFRALTNNIYIHNDRNNFIRAQNLYHSLLQRIYSLGDAAQLMERSRGLGHQVSVWTGYIVCIITMYVVLRDKFNF